MKIAVLLFGQPRFLNMTRKMIKEEFDLPGHTVHYFFHFWNKMGYVPGGEEEIYDKEELIRQIKADDCLPKKAVRKDIMIQDYNEECRQLYRMSPVASMSLNDMCEKINTSRKLFTHPLPNQHLSDNIRDLHYRFGQHLSILKCFAAIKQFEQYNEFKYDIIIKTRTDIVYRPEQTYESKEEYYKNKLDYYTNITLDRPAIKCNVLRLIDYTEKALKKSRSGFQQPIRAFCNKKFLVCKHNHIKLNPHQQNGWLDYVENYNIRVALNDWSLIANREAAEIMYNCWFDNYFMTLAKDIKYNKSFKSVISQSEHSLQGQFLLNYNILAEKIEKRRDVRLLHPTIIKEGFDAKGTIAANGEDYIREQLLVHKFKGG